VLRIDHKTIHKQRVLLGLKCFTFFFFARSVSHHASNAPYVGLMLFSSKIYLLGEDIMICLKKTYFFILMLCDFGNNRMENSYFMWTFDL
jgi:hypothetical protein